MLTWRTPGKGAQCGRRTGRVAQRSTSELSREGESGFWRLPREGSHIAGEGAPGCPSSEQQLLEACDPRQGPEEAPSGHSGLTVVWLKPEAGLGPPSPSFGRKASGLLETAYCDLEIQPASQHEARSEALWLLITACLSIQHRFSHFYWTSPTTNALALLCFCRISKTLS